MSNGSRPNVLFSTPHCVSVLFNKIIHKSTCRTPFRGVHKLKENHVRKSRKILFRLARCQRTEETQELQHRTRRAHLRARTEIGGTPKREGADGTLVAILRKRFLGPDTKSKGGTYCIAKRLIGLAGDLHPAQLSAAHIADLEDQWRGDNLASSTKSHYAKATRVILRWLTDYHGAPRLAQVVGKYAKAKPRNVTISNQEKEALIRAAKPHLRLLLLLCSDLAIRSGTAARLAPEHYNPATCELTFRTKCQENMTLPVTEEIIELLNQCEPTDPAPFVRQLWYRDRHHGPKPAPRGKNMDALWKQFRDLKESVGITRSIRPHDLRRTAAVKIYRLTGDLRAAQALLGHVDLASTLHYLDHHLTPVKRSDLELIKKQERKSA